MPVIRRILLIFALVLASAWASSEHLSAQANGGRPRVFLDCQGGNCDRTWFRTEIDWVVWVRDQADANLHIIFTRQNTGAGGREYVLDFIGRGPYATYVSQTLYNTLPTDTQQEELDGVSLALAVGIANFATQNGFRDLLEVRGVGAGPAGDLPVQGVLSQEEANDPWNLWIFNVRANGNFDSETSEQTWRLNGSLEASRVSPTWKQNYRVNYNRSSREYELSSGTFTDTRYDWGVNWRASYALAEHFSLGVSGNVGRNTRNNQDVWGQMNPAVEYSFFPYEEATRRSLTAFYEVGPVYRHYFEETLLGETEELKAEQALSISFEQRQPWGSAFWQIRGSTYLHDLGTNNLRFNGNLSFRVARGLDLEFGGSYSRVRDQIFLAAGNLTDEERLLELAQQQTDYQAEVRFGFRYQFGSIYNNVVNNRF